MKHLILSLILSLSFSVSATTWDEPWADEVIKAADHFVLAKIKSCDEEKGIEVEILKTLAGEKLSGELLINNFYMLDLTSTSGHSHGHFHLKGIEESYFFLKKNKKGQYCMATPTAGFDYVVEKNVYATYRHSYHQALVPQDAYEMTMTAIYKHYHGEKYDKKEITKYIDKQLLHQPAGFEKHEIDLFFSQHVALETIYHLRLDGFYHRLPVFLNDTANFHNQVSGARAMAAYNTDACKQQLFSVLENKDQSIFVKVICIWVLAEFKPKEMKDKLKELLPTASEEDNGFGGNIMDPRVGTHFPTVKSALEKLVAMLE